MLKLAIFFKYLQSILLEYNLVKASTKFEIQKYFQKDLKLFILTKF